VVEYDRDGTVFIQFGDASTDAESSDVRQRQQDAITVLGEDAFFDIARPARSLAIPGSLTSK
jgi:hypothetical protein